MIAGALTSTELFRSENLGINFATDLFGHAGEQLTQLTQGDSADDKKIDVAMCLFAAVRKRAKNKSDLNIFLFLERVTQQIGQTARLQHQPADLRV